MCSDVLGEVKKREVSWARPREGAGGCEGQRGCDSCGWGEGNAGIRWLDIYVCAFQGMRALLCASLPVCLSYHIFLWRRNKIYAFVHVDARLRDLKGPTAPESKTGVNFKIILSISGLG